MIGDSNLPIPKDETPKMPPGKVINLMDAAEQLAAR
jgi:hypothetical protein